MHKHTFLAWLFLIVVLAGLLALAHSLSEADAADQGSRVRSNDASVIFNARDGDYAKPSTATPTPTPTSTPTPTNTPTATPTATPTPAPVYVPLLAKNFCSGSLYSDDFSNPNSGWSTGDYTSNRYQYLNGEFQIFGKSAGKYGYTTPNLALPCTVMIEVDARQAGGPPGSYGIVFGLTVDPVYEFYTFKVFPASQQYSLQKYDEINGWVQLADWTSSTAIHLGSSTNHLNVTWQGSQLMLYVNSVLLRTIAQSPFSGLRDMGIYAESYSSYGGGIDMRFDNFRVSCPQ